MKNLTNQEIIDLYYSDLSELYTTDKEDNIIWNEEKLEQYWSHFYKFIEHNGPTIKNLIIPKYTSHYFIKEPKGSELHIISFNNCIFLDDINFTDSLIEEIYFSDCIFKKGIYFNQQKKDNILNHIEVKSSTICESLSFQDCDIKSIFIDSNTIFGSLLFKNCEILDALKFHNLSIGELISFTDSLFISDQKLTFSDLKKLDKQLLNFQDFFLIEQLKNEFTNSQSNDSISSIIHSALFLYSPGKFLDYVKKKNQFEELKIDIEYLEKIIKIQAFSTYKKENPIFKIENSTIYNPATIYNTSLFNFSFRNTNIEKINFINCKWNIKNRLLLLDESRIKNDDSIEDQYRQLKKIFSKDQDWDKSGQAYMSEMIMREKRLGYAVDERKRYFSKDALEYLVYFFIET